MPVSQWVFSRWKSVSNSVIFCWQNKTCWSDRSRLLRAHVDLSDLINFHHTHSSQIKLIFNFFFFSSIFHERMLHQHHYIKFQSNFSRSLFPFELLFSLLTLSALLMHMQSMKLTKIFTKQLALFMRIFLHTRHSSASVVRILWLECFDFSNLVPIERMKMFELIPQFFVYV